MNNSKNISDDVSIHHATTTNKNISKFLGLMIVLLIVILALVAAILGFLIVKLNKTQNIIINNSSSPSILSDSITIDQILIHLNEFQRIAVESNGTRHINSIGFNKTVDYIYNHLTQKTNLDVHKQYFDVPNFALNSTPILISYINGQRFDYIYDVNFTHMQFSGPTLNWPTTGYPTTHVPNLGCTDLDWEQVQANDKVAIVKRGDCTYREKTVLASKYNVRGVLFYNDGISSEREKPVMAGVPTDTKFPCFSLSYQAGLQLAQNTQTTSIVMNIVVKPLPPTIVTNVCADTKTGDKTQTIVIGSHSDSVAAGSGINDNGSGTAATLVIATNLDHFLSKQSSVYSAYAYRVRFCWWGAEESGLVGSTEHIHRANTSTEIGNRTIDYLVNLNFDMLASPNFVIAIYDGNTANNVSTPLSAIVGSIKLTQLFINYFTTKNMPWDSKIFDGRSDYGPFLFAGIVCSGLSAGVDLTKTKEQRDRYYRLLNEEGGMANVVYDPCYHQQCDTIENINPVIYEILVKAAAYMIEYLGQLNDLKTWLYPNGQTTRSLPSLNINDVVLNNYYRAKDL